jgi:chemotaxis protein histidine kinase CheA
LAAIQSEQRRLAEEAAERKAAENEILRARAEAEQARMDADRARAEAEQAKAQAAAAAAAAEKQRAEEEAQKAKAQAEADAAAAAAAAERQRAEEEAQKAKAQAEADAAAAAAAAQRKQAQDESRRATEAEAAERIKAMDAELEARRRALEEMDAKQRKKEEELLRVAERASEIDFATLGVAARSEVSEPVEKGATELSVGDTSAFEESGSAWVQDQDGGMSISWTGKTASALIGVTGLKRAFAAAATVTARDDLQRIKGVGPFIAEKLNMLGITTFRQVANMTPELEDQVNTAIEFFPGRVRRDKWAAQAAKLADE